MKPKKAKVCVWFGQIGEGAGYKYLTRCGWLTIENKIKFCPFCGGKIREQK